MSSAPPYETFQAMCLRATKIDPAGHPVLGASNGYQLHAVVDVGVDLDIEAGAEDTLKRGDGQICATSLEDDIIKRAKLDLNLCALDAAFISLVTGAILYADAGVPVGYEVLGPDDTPPNGTILEAWSKAWDNSVQAAPTILGAVAYWHWVFPAFKGTMGKVVLDTKHNAVPVSGTSGMNANATVNGPYDDWPSYIATAGGVTRPYGVFLDTHLPDEANDGVLAVTALAS